VQSTDRLIAIGPEGGWTPGELALAQDRVGFGEAVLRVETAALVACVEMCGGND
jgi:16S rRNA U1498 N3-methylase RsmE